MVIIVFNVFRARVSLNIKHGNDRSNPPWRVSLKLPIIRQVMGRTCTFPVPNPPAVKVCSVVEFGACKTEQKGCRWVLFFVQP